MCADVPVVRVFGDDNGQNIHHADSGLTSVLYTVVFWKRTEIPRKFYSVLYRQMHKDRELRLLVDVEGVFYTDTFCAIVCIEENTGNVTTDVMIGW